MPPTRLIQYFSIGAAALSVFLMGGDVFGFASLYPVLYNEGVFADMCASDDEGECEPSRSSCCPAQQLRYTLLSSVAFFASDGVMVLYGELMDRCGPRFTFGCGITFAWMGLALLGVGALLPSIDALWYLGFGALGVAGPGVFMGCLVLGEVWPPLEPVVTSLAASMWDTSSVVFFLWQLLYFGAGWQLRHVAWAFLGLCVFVGGATCTLLPSWEQVRRLRDLSTPLTSFGELPPTPSYLPSRSATPAQSRRSTPHSSLSTTPLRLPSLSVAPGGFGEAAQPSAPQPSRCPSSSFESLPQPTARFPSAPLAATTTATGTAPPRLPTVVGSPPYPSALPSPPATQPPPSPPQPQPPPSPALQAAPQPAVTGSGDPPPPSQQPQLQQQPCFAAAAPLPPVPASRSGHAPSHASLASLSSGGQSSSGEIDYPLLGHAAGLRASRSSADRSGGSADRSGGGGASIFATHPPLLEDFATAEPWLGLGPGLDGKTPSFYGCGVGVGGGGFGAAGGGGGAATLYDSETSLVELFWRSDTLLLLLFMSVYNLRSAFYIATLSDQMTALFDDGAEAARVQATFDVAFPVGGLLTSIAATAMLQRWGKHEERYMLVVLTAANVFGLANLLPYYEAQLVAACLFGCARTLQWACYFHLLARPTRYPPAILGRMMGYGNLVIAIVGDGLPYALNSYIAAAKHPGAAWPASAQGRYVLLNGAMQLVTLGCLALPLVLRRTNLELRKGSLAGAVGVMVAAAPMNGASFGPQAR